MARWFVKQAGRKWVRRCPYCHLITIHETQPADHWTCDCKAIVSPDLYRRLARLAQKTEVNITPIAAAAARIISRRIMRCPAKCGDCPHGDAHLENDTCEGICYTNPDIERCEHVRLRGKALHGRLAG